MLQQFPNVFATAEPGKPKHDLFLTLTECFFLTSSDHEHSGVAKQKTQYLWFAEICFADIYSGDYVA